MDKFIKQYQILYRKANVDFRSAQNLYDDFQEGDAQLDLDVVMFHLQQCAEKCIKSVLSFYRVDFPKVHDLELLTKFVEENNISLRLDVNKLIDLNEYAIESRYAIIHDDLDDIEQYFQFLRSLLSQAEDLISSS